jgi:hypothetical protein
VLPVFLSLFSPSLFSLLLPLPAFWTVTTILNALKEFSDEVLGKYSSFLLWKFSILLIKLLPVLLTPDYIYSHFVAPFFASHQTQIDTVVEVAEQTKKNVLTLPKESVEQAREKLEEVKEKLISAGEGVREKLEEMGQQIKETISPSSNHSGSGSEASSEDELVELDNQGEPVVRLKQRKREENREHLRQLSLQKTEMSDREKEVVKEMQKESTEVERGQDWEANNNRKEL